MYYNTHFQLVLSIAKTSDSGLHWSYMYYETYNTHCNTLFLPVLSMAKTSDDGIDWPYL